MKKSLMINFRYVSPDDMQSYIEVVFSSVHLCIFDIRSLAFVHWLEEKSSQYDGVMCLAFSLVIPMHGDLILYGYDSSEFKTFPSQTSDFKRYLSEYRRLYLSKVFEEDCELIKLFRVFMSELQRKLLGLNYDL